MHGRGVLFMVEFYGVLGEKLGHSLSPRIHNMIFEEIGVEGAYRLFEVPREKVEEFVSVMKLLKIKGVSVTIPYKSIIMKHLDVISPEAEKIGAVNTISLEGDELHGYNTDYFGFGYMIETSNIDLEGKTVVILGNGGVTKAAIHYLKDNKVSKIYIVSRTPKNAKGIKEENIEIISYDQIENISGDILINATPVGMFPKEDVCPVDQEVIIKFDTIVDLIYNPSKTVLISKAEELGKKTVGGLSMLIGQGVMQQEIWQKRKIDGQVIKDIYEILNREFS